MGGGESKKKGRRGPEKPSRAGKKQKKLTHTRPLSASFASESNILRRMCSGKSFQFLGFLLLITSSEKAGRELPTTRSIFALVDKFAAETLAMLWPFSLGVAFHEAREDEEGKPEKKTKKKGKNPFYSTLGKKRRRAPGRALGNRTETETGNHAPARAFFFSFPLLDSVACVSLSLFHSVSSPRRCCALIILLLPLRRVFFSSLSLFSLFSSFPSIFSIDTRKQNQEARVDFT